MGGEDVSYSELGVCHMKKEKRKKKERSRHLLRDIEVSGKLLPMRPNSPNPILKGTGVLVSDLPNSSPYKI